MNIHLTGCPHSCAQHHVADIGLLAVSVEVKGEPGQGYDVFVGGGAGPEQALGREIARDVPQPELARRGPLPHLLAIPISSTIPRARSRDWAPFLHSRHR